MMGLGPELRAPDPLSGAPSTQVGLGVGVKGLLEELGRTVKQQLTLIKCFDTYKSLAYIISFEAGTIFHFASGDVGAQRG